MVRSTHLRRTLALGAALVVGTWGAAALPASAEPGSGQSAQHAGSPGGSHASPASTQTKHKPTKHHADQGTHGHRGAGAGHPNHAGGNGAGHPNHAGGNGAGHSNHAGGNGAGHPNHAGGNGAGHAGGNGASHGGGNGAGHAGGNGASHGGGNGDPAGNNGTVKIAPLGEMDGIPNNTPHPGCTFQVEWYGFDEGADIISTVTFAMQAPTSDVRLSVDGDPTVFVGGDPASGAGTATGLDGTETYTLSFDGAPHPKQGYHVKLTVATPRSNGNDTKTKVFWVEPCAPGATPGEKDTHGGAGGSGGTSEHSTTPGATAPTQAAADSRGGISVLGEQASVGAAPHQAGQSSSGVPTAVEAGEHGSALELVRSPLGLLIIGLGALLAVAAVVTRRRTRVGAGE
jgi:hypothetical protein